LAADNPVELHCPAALRYYLTTIEKPFSSLLALFAARFSIKVLSGFFFSCFLVSLPLLMFVAPYDWFEMPCAKHAHAIDICPFTHSTTFLHTQQLLDFL
jgi:hypothetical protein